ncbi:MAG: hypothetical protein ACXVJ7_11295 [Acidimicrobiia bacterium]
MTTTPEAAIGPRRAPGDVRADADDRRRFLIVAGGVTAAVTLALIVLSVHAADGHLVYVLDDPAIHMSMARQLSQHGTWGVTNGVFEAASSSPLWTATLAGIAWVVPSSLNLLPLLLNVLAAAGILWVFARNQTFAAPRRAAPMSYVAAALMPTALLMLPGLVMVGMEHLAHALLTLLIVVQLVRLEATDLDRRTTLRFCLLMFLAGTIRVETVFLALGVAVGLVVRRSRWFDAPHIQWTWYATIRTGVLAVFSGALPFLIYGAVNKAFGHGFLPNSIAAKQAIGQRSFFRSPGNIMNALLTDPILMILVLLAVAYLCIPNARSTKDQALAAVFLIIAVIAQATWGDIGFWNRYEAYLVIAGTLILCRMASEVLTERAWRPALLLFVLGFAALSSVRMGLTIDTPTAASNTYRQRYQLGKFFEKEYRGQTVATGELGYVTLFHDGPVLDFLGLGSADVAQALRDHDGELPRGVVAQLVRDHHVKAVGVYPATLAVAHAPRDFWIVGRWHLKERNVSGFEPDVDFYAPTLADRRPLAARFRQFTPELPSRVRALTRAQILKSFFGLG